MENVKISDIFNALDASALLELALILASAIASIMVLQKVLPWIAAQLHDQRRHFILAFVPLLRLFIIIAAFLLSVPLIIEPSLQNMVALFGSLGLALGFALKDYASSLIAGIVATGERPYRNGDWIEIGGAYGEVTHVGLRTVQVTTADDTLYHIPHLKIWNELVANANNGTPRLQTVTDFYLDPHHDGDKAREILYDVALSSTYVSLKEPIVVVLKEKPWDTHYRLKAYPVDPGQQFSFIADLSIRGREILQKSGFRFAQMGIASASE
ncbi:MAG: mechanosensitive ion channel family protein [Thermodesulfobacteriota bacterium]